MNCRRVQGIFTFESSHLLYCFFMSLLQIELNCASQGEPLLGFEHASVLNPKDCCFLCYESMRIRRRRREVARIDLG
jgi:hypothetical protein